MRLTREESRERTRERLLEAARTCFVRQGYEGASIFDIAEEAGFTKGAFFSNFENKEALLLELTRRHKADQIRRLRELEEGAPDVLSPALISYIDGIETDCDLVLLDIQLELQASRNPAFAARYAEDEKVFNSALAELLLRAFRRAHRVPPADPLQLAVLMTSSIHGLLLSKQANPERPPVAELIKLLLRSLLAVAAPELSD